MGAKPLIQIPLIDNYKKNGAANPADAAAIVAYCKSKGYGVKYWEIGNEPDLYGSVNNGVTDIPGYTVDKFIADFKAFASAMKGVDSSIEILGPELSWKYYPNQPKNGANDWLTPFLAQCRGSYDIVTIHRYPFSAAQCSIANAMGDVRTCPTRIAPRRSSPRWPTLFAPLASRGSGPTITGVSRSPGPSASSIRAT